MRHKYIKVIDEIYRSPNQQQTETRYVGGAVETRWVNARPTLLVPNLKERLIHLIGRHISFGQPYCVICGKKEMEVEPTVVDARTDASKPIPNEEYRICEKCGNAHEKREEAARCCEHKPVKDPSVKF